DGRTAVVAGKSQRLATTGLEITVVPPDWRTEFLAVITNPNVAFLLMLIGIYGLIFEFLNPGSVAPGLVGAISLLVALFALAFLLRSGRRPVVTGGEALVGTRGEVVAWSGSGGRVRIAGEIWLARGASELAAGAQIKVVDRDGLTLVVEQA